MGKVSQQQFNQPTDPVEFDRYISICVGQIIDVLNNGLSFKDNFTGNIVTVDFPNTTTAVNIPHNLGRKPEGYISIGQSSGGIVYDGGVSSANSLPLFATSRGTYKILIF